MQKKLISRKNIRIKDFDYSTEGFYFVTICTNNRKKLLGKIELENIKLTKIGILVRENLKKIETIFKNIIIDEFIIMPNHIHMIIVINRKNEITISRIIKQYKMYISKKVGYSIWQKSFYEHIIRNEKEYLQIKEYIKNNIINWKKDEYF